MKANRHRGSRNRKVVIFGGAGFIGSNWAHYLLTRTDASVLVFDNFSRRGVRHNLEWLRRSCPQPERLQVIPGDVREVSQVNRAVADASEIYHFAAQVAVTTSVINPRLDFEINMAGTFNILEAARQSGNQPFLLFTSTNKVYGDMGDSGVVAGRRRYRYADRTGISEEQPLDFHSPYGCSKGAADQYVRDYARIYGLPAVVFRMSCIAGEQQFGNEDQGWVAHFVYSALQRHPVVIYGDGRQVRDVLYVGDLLRAFDAARLSIQQTRGEIYNIGGGAGNTVSLLELVDLIQEISGERLEFEHDERRPGAQLIYVTDFSKFSRHTGWLPQTSLPETVRCICRWWEQNRELFAPAAAVADAPAAVPSPLAGLPRMA